jgi:hypothetical protein
MQEDKEFRQGMPVGYPNYGGCVSEEVKIIDFRTSLGQLIVFFYTD